MGTDGTGKAPKSTHRHSKIEFGTLSGTLSVLFGTAQWVLNEWISITWADLTARIGKPAIAAPSYKFDRPWYTGA